MSNPYVRVLDHVETVHGQRVAIGVDYDSVTVDGLQLGPEARGKFARLYFQADTEAKAWAEANPAEPDAYLRPCCDHCNNGQGDPAGHDYTLNGPHDGPCGECAAERARREHDEGTG